MNKSRTRTLGVKVSPAEKNLFRSIRDQQGFRTDSHFLRTVLTAYLQGMVANEFDLSRPLERQLNAAA